MALIKCPECNHEVSEFAASCPNCGYGITKQNELKFQAIPQTKSNSIPIFLLFVFLFIAFVSIMLLCKVMSEMPHVETMVDISRTPKEYEEELSALKLKRNISIVAAIVSLISSCVCFLVIKNNDKNNEIIEKSQKSEESS